MMCDSEEPISEAWLDSIGAQRGNLYYTILIAPFNSTAAITEMQFIPIETGWNISLVQGVLPDDHVALTSLPDHPTVGQIKALCEALGREIP